MNCPKCDSKMGVTSTKYGSAIVKRYRKCLNKVCGYSTSTKEVETKVIDGLEDDLKASQLHRIKLLDAVKAVGG